MNASLSSPIPEPEEKASATQWRAQILQAEDKPTMKISNICKILKEEFPALQVSKVRYLEARGILVPHRTPTGYRLFSARDVEKIRYILTLQRDWSLNLNVIKVELSKLLEGGDNSNFPTARLVSSRGKLVEHRLSLRDLQDMTGATDSDIQQMVDRGILSPDYRGLFSPRAHKIVLLIMQLQTVGITPRHLYSLRNGAQNMADIIEQSVGVAHPRQRASDREYAYTRSDELATICANLQAELLRVAVEKNRI